MSEPSLVKWAEEMEGLAQEMVKDPKLPAKAKKLLIGQTIFKIKMEMELFYCSKQAQQAIGEIINNMRNLVRNLPADDRDSIPLEVRVMDTDLTMTI